MNFVESGGQSRDNSGTAEAPFENELDGLLITCSGCHCTKPAKAGKSDVKLPRGWKRRRGDVICDKCWHSTFTLRAITCPVAEATDATKDELWDAVRKCWEASTTAANLAVQALMKAEELRTPAQQKIGKAPQVYLYGLVPPAICGMDPASHSALMQTVAAKWRSKRFAVIWKRDERPPLYQYPVPYPVRADCWEAKLDPDGAMLVDLRFGGRRFTLRLKADHGMRRNRTRFKQLAGGEAIGVEAAIYRSGDRKRIMLKLVGWFPRQEPREVDGTMELRTGGGRFLTATIGQREPWLYNADDIRQLIAAHAEYRQRMADDLKYEKRHPKRTRGRMLDSLGRRCDKMNARLDNFLHQSSRLVVDYAKRQGVAEVRYDATDKGYFTSFPWFVFTENLRYKLDDAGIRLKVIDGSGDQKTPGTARKTTNQETEQ